MEIMGPIPDIHEPQTFQSGVYFLPHQSNMPPIRPPVSNAFADRSEPANSACGRLVRPRLARYAADFLRSETRALTLLKFAKAARVLRALPVFRRHRQRNRHALPDTSWHPDQHRGSEPHGATCLQMVLRAGGQPRRWRCQLAQKIALETNERGALSVAHRSFVSMGSPR
jgi:hypothetical protein